MPSNFDFHARYALLTYSQCEGLRPESIAECLNLDEEQYIIARERHDDGGIHFHVFIDFRRKRRIRDARKFDVEGYHPNISPSRGTPTRGYYYTIKDGEIVLGRLQRPTTGRSGIPENESSWAELALCEDSDTFWELLRSNHPKALITQYPAIKRYADGQFAQRPVVYESPSFQLCEGRAPELDEWSMEYIGTTERPITREGSGSKYDPLLGPLSRGHGDPSGG